MKAREDNVSILCIPPHTSHKLQPLDVGVLFPLSRYLDNALENWLNNHPGRVITVFQISNLFCQAYLKACTAGNAINAFRKCGIHPFDSNLFQDFEFSAATVTDQSIEGDLTGNNEVKTNENHTSQEEENQMDQEEDKENQFVSNEGQGLLDTTAINKTDIKSMPGTSSAAQEQLHKDQLFFIFPKDIRPLPEKQTMSKKKGGRKKDQRRFSPLVHIRIC
ncbi:hypothetical protein JTB14_024682 [Gonioctena quinquepunctata]|nr:hypothetical protein JTB14_024682 [Gonioctena quinquepunctata]